MGLARSRDRAEALALSEGEAEEGAASSRRYADLRRHQQLRVRWRTGLASFRDYFSWAAHLLPIAIVAPLWLRGDVAFGVIAQSVTAFEVSLAALAVVIRKFRSVSSLVAEGGRLEGLFEALGHARAVVPSPNVVTAGVGTSFNAVSLSLPSGATICKSLALALQPSNRLIIVGESGIGKTTLVRALAGLWAHGSGEVRRAHSTVFLSQEPYIPDGALRRVLTFPSPDGVFSDDRIIASARAAMLGGVLERYTLDATADWEAVLSRGEQQRCAFCRLLLFEPELAVLDEATSALDEDMEAALYSALKAPCVVSVSHRPSLLRSHTHMLYKKAKEDGKADGEEAGTWIFEPIAG